MLRRAPSSSATGFIKLRHVSRDLADVERDLLDLGRLSLNPRDPQQRIEGTDQALGFFKRLFQCLTGSFPCRHSLTQG